jgi:hypothetical protein
MTRVTIGPGIRNKTRVMSRNAVNNCQFIDPPVPEAALTDSLITSRPGLLTGT